MSDLSMPDKPDTELVDIVDNIRELAAAQFIQSMRIYDMLCLIADNLGADAMGLSKLHEKGETLSPAPSFKLDDDEEITPQ